MTDLKYATEKRFVFEQISVDKINVKVCNKGSSIKLIVI